jgi:hypothetical protein
MVCDGVRTILMSGRVAGWYWFLLVVTVVIALLPFWTTACASAFYFPDGAQLVREQVMLGFPPFDKSTDISP